MNSTRRFFIHLSILVCIGLGIGGFFAAVVTAQTPVTDKSPVSVLLTMQSDPDPLQSGQEARFDLVLSARQEPDAVCYGIPLEALDLFFVLDNSGSAGAGENSNLERTRQWMDTMVDLAEQQGPIGTPLQPTRIGLAASRVGVEGIETLWATLTDDYDSARQFLIDLPSGGDTELAPAIRRAVLTLQQMARRGARQVLALMLHDRLPLTDDTLAAIQQAQQEGIYVYLFANSLNVKTGETIDAALAQSIVDAEYLATDPTQEQLRHIFVQMTGGSANDLARNITITVLASPAGLTAPTLSPSGTVITDTVTWVIPQLVAQEQVKLTYQGYVNSAIGYNGQMGLTAWIAYQDCNGQLRSLSSSFDFRAHELPTPTPTFSPTPMQTAMPPTPTRVVAETPTQAAMLIVPTAQPGGATPPPGIGGIDIPTPQIGPIDRLVTWLAGLIPGISSLVTPLLGFLPVFLQWLLIILFVLLLLFLLWRLFEMLRKRWGRPKPQSQPQPTEPITPPPPPPVPTLPRWIPALPKNTLLAGAGSARTIATATPHPLQDTLLIGLGPAGREVLAQVASGLVDRFGDQTPANIHLLQVDVQPERAPGQMTLPPGLRPEQWVLLRPDLQTVEESLRRNPGNYPHWQWYANAAPEYERARGRMAVFYDIQNQTQNSALWKAIERGIRDLDKPVIRVIGTTFDDVSSGMLVDIARLTQIAAGGVDGNIQVQLWLAGPLGRDWGERLGVRGKVRADEQITRTLATLRELERFQRNARRRFDYVPQTNRQDVLRALYHYAVINKLVIFQPMDTPPPPPEHDTLTCMADCLLALFDSEANRQWNDLLKDTDERMGEQVNVRGQGAALAMGCYALRKPGAAMRRAMAWRMVRDVLFETALGLHPLEKVMASGEYQRLPEHEQGQPLKSVPAFTANEIETLVEKHKDYLDAPAFEAAVRSRVNALLNGEHDGAGDADVLRRAGLSQATSWLKMLKKQLEQQNASDAAQRVNGLIRQLNHWQTWLRDQVYPLCEHEFKTARDELLRLRAQPARGWGLDDRLEWPLYRDLIRRWDAAPMGAAQGEPLLRLTARFGWEVETTPQGWRARLLVPPGEFDETVDARRLDLLRPYEIVPKPDPADLLQRLYDLAARAAQVDTQTTAVDLALRQDMARWAEQARLRLEFDPNEASLMQHVNERSLLVMPESAAHKSTLEQNLSSVPGIAGGLYVCETNDATAVTLLQATSWLPLTSLKLYDAETWQTHPTPPYLYVWRAEQLAAASETDERISALFVDRIDQNEPLLRAFGLSLIYEAIKPEGRFWAVPGLDQPAGSLLLALEQLFAGDAKEQAARLEALQDALAKRREQVTQPLTYLKQAEADRVKPLAGSDDPRERDLAAYLSGLIADERNR